MKVYGIEITDDQIAAAIDRMKQSPFHNLSIDAILEQKGVPGRIPGDPVCFGDRFVSMRAADRIIQIERKKGNLSLDRKSRFPWKWTKL